MKERSGLASQSSGGHQFSPPVSVPQSQPRVNESLRLQSLDGPPDRPPELTNVREVESVKLGSELPTPHQRKGPGNIEEEEKQQVVDLDCEEGQEDGSVANPKPLAKQEDQDEHDGHEEADEEVRRIVSPNSASASPASPMKEEKKEKVKENPVEKPR